jgi:hypothetical protein
LPVDVLLERNPGKQRILVEVTGQRKLQQDAAHLRSPGKLIQHSLDLSL